MTKHPALQLLQKIVAEDDGANVPGNLPRPRRDARPLVSSTCGRTAAHYDEPQHDAGRRVRRLVAGQPGGLASRRFRRKIAMADHRLRRSDPDPQERRPGRIRARLLAAEELSWTTFSDRSTICRDMVAGRPVLRRRGAALRIDALRRKGKRIGGMTNWDFNEPWPNGAGSYLVDYDGRTLMNYDFFKQALAPISLSLRYDSVFYSLREWASRRNCF